MKSKPSARPGLSTITVVAIWLLGGLLGGIVILFGVAANTIEGHVSGIAIGVAILVATYMAIRLLRRLLFAHTPTTPANIAPETWSTTETPEASASHGLTKEQWIGLVGALFLGLIVYKFVFSGSALFALGEALAPQSELENATILERSTKAQWQAFKDDGGLDASPSWNGLYVTEVVPQYAGAGDTLSAVKLNFSGKARWMPGAGKWIRDSQLSPKELRAVVSKICGVNDDQWQHTDGDRNFGTVETATRKCAYQHQGNEVTAFIATAAAR